MVRLHVGRRRYDKLFNLRRARWGLPSACRRSKQENKTGYECSNCVFVFSFFLVAIFVFRFFPRFDANGLVCWLASHLFALEWYPLASALFSPITLLYLQCVSLDRSVSGRRGGVSGCPRAWYRSVSWVRVPPSAYSYKFVGTFSCA